MAQFLLPSLSYFFLLKGDIWGEEAIFFNEKELVVYDREKEKKILFLKFS